MYMNHRIVAESVERAVRLQAQAWLCLVRAAWPWQFLTSPYSGPLIWRKGRLIEPKP